MNRLILWLRRVIGVRDEFTFFVHEVRGAVRSAPETREWVSTSPVVLSCGDTIHFDDAYTRGGDMPYLNIAIRRKGRRAVLDITIRNIQ